MDSLDINGELICVNDGSSDKTESLIKNLIKSDARVRLINHNEPKGFGASFWHGVELAKGNAVTYIPGDNENDPWETLRYLNLNNTFRTRLNYTNGTVIYNPFCSQPICKILF